MTDTTTMNWQKRKTVHFGIKRDFQVWLLIRILTTAVLTIIIAAVFSYLYAKNVVATDILSFKANIRIVEEEFWPTFLAAVLASIFSGLLLALFLPKKIAGPLYRIEADLKQIGAGDLTKTIRIRSGDILAEHADAVNLAVDQIGTMIKGAKDAGINLETKLIEGKIDHIQEAFECLKQLLDRINTGP